MQFKKEHLSWAGIVAIFLSIWLPFYNWQMFISGCFLILLWSFTDEPSRKNLKKKISKAVDEWEKTSR